MNYAKRRRLTASDEDSDPCSLTECRESFNSESGKTRDAVSLSRTLRDGFSWFVNSFMTSMRMPYRIFKSKEKPESTTDVFLKPSQAVSKSSQVYLLSKEKPKYQYTNSFNTYSPLNTKRRMSLNRPNFLNSKRDQLPSKSGMNSKDFYGKPNKISDCVVIVEEESTSQSSTEKEICSSFLHNIGASQNSRDTEEVNLCMINEEIDENQNSEFDLFVRKVYFGSYSCLVKGLKVNRDCFKFLNVPSNSVTKFKYHISIPISEICEISSCISDVQFFLLLRTVPSSHSKIRNSLKLEDAREDGLIIIEMEPTTKCLWKNIEALLTNLPPEVSYKRINFIEINKIIKELQESPKSPGKSETVIVNRVCPEKRKVAKSTKSNLLKSKQMKPNTVIELDDCCEVDEKPVNCSASDVVLYYPPDEKDTITIYSYDMNCLEEEQFLNDSILGFYLKYIQKEIADKSVASKCYIFNTFFYGKLSKLRRTEDTSKPIAERVYDRVKNWTKSVDIFEKDFLIIPMNKNYHWFLAIVCYPKLVSLATSNWKDQCKIDNSPCIIYMDSLGTAKGGRLSDPIRHFLSMEWQRKKGTQMSFGKQVLPDHYPRVPYQTNSSDCGLFVLQYVEQFLKDPNFVLNNLASVVLEEWFPLSVINNKRNDLRFLIKMLANESRMECEDEQKPVEDKTEMMNEDMESPIPNISKSTSSVSHEKD